MHSRCSGRLARPSSGCRRSRGSSASTPSLPAPRPKSWPDAFVGSFYDLLKKRRAVRSYSGEPVPRETLERIARAARRGPNAGYSQGLRILVVDDPAVMEGLVDAEAEERERAWFLKAAA